MYWDKFIPAPNHFKVPLSLSFTASLTVKSLLYQFSVILKLDQIRLVLNDSMVAVVSDLKWGGGGS